MEPVYTEEKSFSWKHFLFLLTDNSKYSPILLVFPNIADVTNPLHYLKNIRLSCLDLVVIFSYYILMVL